jgi:acyl transferase domain-containing protein/acyl carrier protein
LQENKEPIAIIGMGCRFPGGANNPTTFWDLLSNGKDAIVDIPKNRWDIRRFYDPNPDKPGKMYVHSGGFLQERIDKFDALFFGISPREAACLDPQQRILLEVAWEALEDAGLVAQQLAGSDMGVYIGGFMLDNTLTQVSYLNRNLIGIHTATSFTMAILANRLSYVFDFRGPSIAIDTACSSSLVAIHEACQSLWRGECTMALVGGVNIMHRPETPVTMCKAQLLAPDGHSKSFDERADGYGRGEGAGIVVLKPFSAAQRDGDNIYALVRGTGVNQDGRTSSITIPNAESQKTLIQKVCIQANVLPQQIHYVEAHGTGTEVGDPIECEALGTILGKNRSPDKACLVGSVKANIGHLEAAAGIASVIKTCLCLKNKQIPPVANLENPNSNIPFEKLGLRLPRKLEPILDSEGPIYMGINAFGYGGTNAHAILEDVAVKEKSLVEDAPCTSYILPLSARSEKALLALAQSYIDFLSKAPPLRDICYSASVRREHHNHRLVVIADSQEGILEHLFSFVSGQKSHLLIGQVIPDQQEIKPVFVFTGMGPQWWAMGHELLQHEPTFRKVAEECDTIFQRLAGWSILAEMKADKNHSKMGETQIAQPANFVLQVALTALWQSWGIEPAAIVGHSVGDVTAAYVAGILDLEDAIRVSYHRSQLQKKAAGLGKMLAVELTADEAKTLLVGYEKHISLAAINSPSAITLSGESKALEEIAAKLESKGIFNRFLRVEVPYHSPFMEPLKNKLRESLSMLRPKAPTIPFYSTVTGQRVKEALCDAEYWCQNIRQPVLFAKSIENLLNDGYQLFLEIGPHPVLSPSIKESLSHQGVKGEVITSLHRKQPERASLLESLGTLYTLNYPIDWKKFYANKGGNYVHLPTYPWQRQTYWNESEESCYDRLGMPEHPLLGQRLNAPVSNYLSWENTLNPNFLPYLIDHRIEELVVLPGAAYVEMGLAIHKEINKKEECVLTDIKFHQALIIEVTDDPILHINYDKKTQEYAVHSRSFDEKSHWTLHATGCISQQSLSDTVQINLDDIQKRCQIFVDSETFYAQHNKRGLQYGPYFQCIHHLWKGTDEILAQIEGYATLSTDNNNYYYLHPTILDGSFQSLIALLDDEPNVYVPIFIHELRYYANPKMRCWVHVCLTKHSAGFIEADIVLCTNDGNVLVEVKKLRCQNLAVKRNEELEDWKQWVYDFVWEQAETENAIKKVCPSGQWLLFMDQGDVGKQLAEQLLSHDAEQIIQIQRGTTFQQTNTTHFQIRCNNKEDMQQTWSQTFEVFKTSKVFVVYLMGLDAPTNQNDPTGMTDSIACLQLIQTLAPIKNLESLTFFLITCNAQPHLNKSSIALAQASLIGLVRVAINEHPDIHFSLVDIEPDKDANNSSLLLKELLTTLDEEEIVLRGGKRFVHRLVKKPIEESKQHSVTHAFPYEFKSENTYLITGGFGGFGLAVAQWMTRLGVMHLVLVGRHGAATKEALQTVQELEKSGIKVFVATADITQKLQVTKLMREIDAIMPPLKGIIHAAAVLDDSLIVDLDEACFSKVMMPKALGAWYLHQHTQNLSLDFFVLFSSVSAQIGNPRQANYAAANVFLDALAHYRRSYGLPATSINWGALTNVGMTDRKEVGQYLEHMGIKGIPSAQAMKALAYLLHWNPIQNSVIHADWQKLGQFNPVLATSPRFSYLISKEKTAIEDSAAHILYHELKMMTSEKQKEEIISLSTKQVGQTLRMPTNQIEIHQPLPKMGVDSLLSMELQIAIQKQFGVKITTLELLKENTITQMATQLLAKMDLTASSTVSSSKTDIIPSQNLQHFADNEMENDWVEGEL